MSFSKRMCFFLLSCKTNTCLFFIKGSVLATDFKVYDGELVNTHTSGSVHAADFNVYDGELVTHTSAGVSSQLCDNEDIEEKLLGLTVLKFPKMIYQMYQLYFKKQLRFKILLM